MAKKKAKTKPKSKRRPARSLNDGQICHLGDMQILRLGDVLAGTSQNVYDVAKSLFGRGVSEEIFTDLENVCGLFCCDHCDAWKAITEREPDFGPVDPGTGSCRTCVDAMNGDPGDLA